MADLSHRAGRLLVSLLPFALRMTPDEVEITLASGLMMARQCRARLRPFGERCGAFARRLACHGRQVDNVSFAR